MTRAAGKFAEKILDASTSVGILVLKTAEADATLRNRTTVADILSANTEATNVGYARKTGLTGTVTEDTVNFKQTVTIPTQTWTGVATAGGAWVKLIVFLDEGGTDATRIPLSQHDFAVTPDGTDIATSSG